MNALIPLTRIRNVKSARIRTTSSTRHALSLVLIHSSPRALVGSIAFAPSPTLPLSVTLVLVTLCSYHPRHAVVGAIATVVCGHRQLRPIARPVRIAFISTMASAWRRVPTEQQHLVVAALVSPVLQQSRDPRAVSMSMRHMIFSLIQLSPKTTHKQFFWLQMPVRTLSAREASDPTVIYPAIAKNIVMHALWILRAATCTA